MYEKNFHLFSVTCWCGFALVCIYFAFSEHFTCIFYNCTSLYGDQLSVNVKLRPIIEINEGEDMEDKGYEIVTVGVPDINALDKTQADIFYSTLLEVILEYFKSHSNKDL